MKISSHLSYKLKIVSLIAIIFVLFIHSTILNVEVHTLFFYVQTLISDYFCRVFQPLFFSISGYLFFIGFKASIEGFIQKYKSRFKSIFIPYIIWNILVLIQMVALKHMPVLGSHINSDVNSFFQLNIIEQINELFVKPYAFHLWFIRDLIIIVLFTPLIYWSIKRINVFFIFILIALDIIGTPIVGSFVPFSIGAYFAIKCINIEREISNNLLLILGIASILIAFLFVIYMFEVSYYLTWPFLLFIWFGYDYLVMKKNITFNFLTRYMPYTFFIYLFHEPSLNIFKRLILLGKSESYLWIAYFLSPLFSIILSILVAQILKRYSNPIYLVLVGGR